MAEIDSLELKLQSNIGDVSKSLEDLTKKIETMSNALSLFGNNKSLEQFSKNIKSVSAGMEKAVNASGLSKSISNAVKEAQKPMEQLSKSIDKIAEELYSKFENFTPKINFSQSVESLKKLSETYQDQMIKAENELNRIMASSSAGKQIKGMERYIIRIQEAKNGIKEISEYLESISNKPIGEAAVHGASDTKEEESDLKNFEEEYLRFVEMVKNGGVETEGGTFLPTREVQMSLEQLREMYPQVKSLIASYEDLFNQLKKMDSGEKFEGVLAEIPEHLKIADNPQDAFKSFTEEVDEFQKVLDSIKPIEFTGNFFEMERWIDGLNQRFSSLQAKIEKLNQLGVDPDTQRLHGLQYDLQEVSVTLEKYKAKLQEAKDAGELDIKIPDIDSQIDRVQERFEKLQNFMQSKNILIPTEGLKKILNEIERVEKKYAQTVESIRKKSQTVKFYGTSTDFKNKMIELDALRNRYQKLINKQRQLQKIGGGGLTFNAKGIADGAKDLQKTFAPIQKVLQKLDKLIGSFTKKVASIVAPMKKVSKATDGFGKSLSLNFRTVLKYGLGIRSLFVLFNRLRGAIIDGMENLVRYSEETNQSLSMLRASLNQTKNSLAAAFSPIINTIAPAVNSLIQLLIKAVNVINQFFSALSGRGTWIKAKETTDDYASSLDKASGAAKKLYSITLGIDELNINSGEENGGGAGNAVDPEELFDTVPISDKIQEFSDKINDILSKLFDPLKKAWDKKGRFVMDSWKKALENVWALIKDIGRDFLRVWEEPATMDIFNNILQIIGDIGLVVANLADRFRIAWNENEVGFHILEKIRDIIGIIVEHIKNAADATVIWSSNLDFYPLLDAFDRFLDSIKPVVDAVSGILEDFYTEVLLKLSEWTIEKGLPELLQVFINFNDMVDWESLRENLKEFWEHLEPFAETVGEGLILFIERVSEALANFLNSQEFKDFLKSVEDWMDNVTPENVADALENIATALITLKIALIGFKAVSAVSGILTTVKNFVSFFGKGGGALGASGEIDNMASSISGLPGALVNLGSTLHIFETFQNVSDSLNAQKKFDETTTSIMNNSKELENLQKKYDDGTISLEEYRYEVDKLLGAEKDLSESKAIADFAKNHKTELEGIKSDYENGRISVSQFKEELELLSQYDSETTGVNIAQGIIDGMEETGDINFSDASRILFDNLISKLWKVFGISSPAENMKPTGEYILLGITEGFSDAIKYFDEVINQFWSENIEPLFSFETWYEKAQGIHDGLALKWEEIVDWWQNTALATWWEENVAPWFTIEKWTTTAQGMYDGIKKKLDETINNWKKSITNWWNTNVAPWFKLTKWQELLSSVPKSFTQAFKDAANGAIGFLNGVISGVESLINKAIEGLRKLAEAASKIPGVNIKFNVKDVHFPRIPTFAIGGFPEDGLFMANSTELVGQFTNGRTAVANNEMIVAGIEEAAYRGFARAYSENTREASLLEELIEAVREGKEITVDGRSLVEAYDTRKARNGYSFT